MSAPAEAPAPSASGSRSDPLRRRYFAKLIANLIGLAMSLVTQSVVLRSLAPKLYGDYSYLTNLATQVVNFFDMGTTLGFFTKLSQRQREFGLVAFYGVFSLALTAVVLALTTLAHVAGAGRVLWPDQRVMYVYLAVIWALVNWFLQAINNIGDAYGLTVPIETARVAQKVLGLALIFAVVVRGLDLTRFFLYNYVVNGGFALAILWILYKTGHFVGARWRLSRQQTHTYASEFSRYSRPLFVYFLTASAVAALDRWLLQIFSGSVEQGYFGISNQIGLVCFLITNSVVTLIMREFSIAYARGDLQQIAALFRRYVPLFYGISAFLSCFIAIQAHAVAQIFGGDKFHDAGLVIAIMAMYQIHQTYGVLSSSMFMATGQTGLYSKISIVSSLLGIPLALALLAPQSRWGLHAGAAGLAVKMLVVQLVGVNVQLHFICRFLALRFRRYLGHQFASVSILFVLAAAATLLANNVVPANRGTTQRFLLAGVIYTAAVAAALWALPPLFGLQRKDLSLRALLPTPKQPAAELRI